jgi:hypothetical protein
MCSESSPTVTGNGETEPGRQGESEYQDIRRSGNHGKSVRRNVMNTNTKHEYDLRDIDLSENFGKIM